MQRSKAGKRITVWGTSFAKIGDEAQIGAILELLADLAPDADVAVLDRPRQATRLFYPHARTIRLAEAWRSVTRLLRSDLLLVVGAPFYETRRQLLACMLVIALSRLGGAAIACYGITVFKTRAAAARRLFRSFFDRMALVAVREQAGLDMLRRLDVAVEPVLVEDQRALLAPDDGVRVAALLRDSGIDPDQPVIALTTRYVHEDVPDWVKDLQGFDADRNRRAVETLGRLMNALSGWAQLLVIPMHPSLDDDRAMVAQIRRHLDDPDRIQMLRPPFSAGQCIGVIARCEMLISSRLSSTTFAANSGTPVMAVAYDPRSAELMARGSAGDFVLRWDELEYEPALALCERLWRERDQVRAAQRADAARRRDKARADAELLRPLVA
ncbi:MAG: polysaccharide pyruvyl transferase family protein [Hyphomicrobiales bacterium]|nr:polysaccharide pyruvyl transferase family protein [Hyphomicrobiales bacterium]MCP5374253.1 polysaccharide pyruvyl transferase family protein [Hyphomicrobiales bacterium]